MSEKSAQRLKTIAAKEGNNQCADCGSRAIEYASFSLGIFLCAECNNVHGSLGTHISKCKGINLGQWDNDQIQSMADKGNENANAIYLVSVPACYRRPDPNCPHVLREQWIRAKYERREFQSMDRQAYMNNRRSGTLFKKGRDDSKFLPRRFELNGKENTLTYYLPDKTKPAGVINLEELNCCFVPEKIGNRNGLQISYADDSARDGTTRHIFVYSEDGKEIVDWYMAIRNAKLERLSIGLPHLPQEDLVNRLTHDFLLEGWLLKTGPNPRDRWCRRWCTLDRRTFMYFTDPLAAKARGEVFIGPSDKEYSVDETLPPGRPDCQGYAFTLRTPEREYCLAAETSQQREDWIKILRKVISTELTAQDTARFRRY